MSTKSTSLSESKSSPLNDIAQQARQKEEAKEFYYWRDIAGITTLPIYLKLFNLGQERPCS